MLMFQRLSGMELCLKDVGISSDIDVLNSDYLLCFCCSETNRYGMGSETPMHPSRTPLHPYMTPMRDSGGMLTA